MPRGREPANDREGIALADTSQLNLFGTVPRRREGGREPSIGYPTGVEGDQIVRPRAARSESRPSSTAQRRRVREPCGSLAGCVTEISCSTRRSFADVQSPVTISTRSAPRPTRPVSHSRHNLPGGRNDTVERLDRDWLPGTSTASPRENFDVDSVTATRTNSPGGRGARRPRDRHRGRPTAPPVAGRSRRTGPENWSLLSSLTPGSLLRHELRQFCRSRRGDEQLV